MLDRIIEVDREAEAACANCVCPFVMGDLVIEHQGFIFCSNDCRHDYAARQSTQTAA